MKSLKCYLIIAATMLALLFIPALASASVTINGPGIPDQNFRQYIINAGFDTDGNGTLDNAELARVTAINCSSEDIHDMTGIEYFHNLKTLTCSYNSFDLLDVSGNTQLERLNCHECDLISLNLGTVASLVSLDCSDNRLTGLTFNVSQPNLYFLSCENNDMDTLNLDPCPLVRAAYLKGEKNDYIETAYKYDDGDHFLYVDHSTAVRCSVPLTSDYFPSVNFRQFISDNYDGDGNRLISPEERTAVTVMNCHSKGIGTLEGIAYFTALQELDCSANELTALDVTGNSALRVLECSNNDLTELNVTGNGALVWLNCSNCWLSTLDLTGAPALETVHCYNNVLTSLNVRNNPALDSLYCYKNQLTALDVTKNPELNSLYCYKNQLSALNITKNTGLYYLDCSSNQLTALNLTKNTVLGQLYCYDNQLASLNLTANPQLTHFDCGSNQLAALNVSRNVKLQVLSAGSNLLTALDVSKNTALKELKCSGNKLSALDVSGNTQLTKLDCADNLLSKLDIRNNSKLRHLDCHTNRLAALDVSRNKLLTYLWCYSNQMTVLDVSRNDPLLNIVEKGTASVVSDVMTYVINANTDIIKTDTITVLEVLGPPFPNARVMLPDNLTTIGAEALAGTGGQYAVIIPPSVVSIGANAFPAGVTIYGCCGSAAETWANKNGFTFIAVTYDWISELREQ